MKKTAFLTIVSLLFLVFATNAFADGAKGIALALKVSGKVQLTRDGKTSNLKFGTVLHNDDKIKTGKDGKVTLVFTDDKSLLKLLDHTEIVIQGKRDQGGNIAKRISLEIGEMFADVKQLRGSMEIATPTAVASIKGTELWIVVDEFGNSFVTTVEGMVELMNSLTGKIVEVRKGQRGEIDEEGNLVVVDLPPDEVPGDPDPDPDPEEDNVIRRTIEIDFADEEGNLRTIRIEFLERVEGDDGDGGDE